MIALFPTGPYVAASASQPIYNAQGELLGMIAADIHLLKLNDFLQALYVQNSTPVFILERDGNLIVNSGEIAPFKVEGDQLDLEFLTPFSPPNPSAKAQGWGCRSAIKLLPKSMGEC